MKSPLQADDRSALGVVEAQLVVEYHVGVQPMFASQLFGEYGAEVHALIAGKLREDRRQLGLGIDRPTLVGFTVEVNGQVGNDGDRQSGNRSAGFRPCRRGGR